MKIDQGFYIPTAFIDLSKAFNSINHDTLLKKLSLIGFYNFSCQLIESFLKDRKQRVSLHGQFSEWINLHQGVPQGTILGPLLSNLYVNDIDNFIEKDCHIIQYADDTMIFAEHKEVKEGTEKIQKNIEKLQVYFQRNELNMNDEKTNFIIFCKPCNKTEVQQEKLTLNNETIECSENVKYLGVLIDQCLMYELEIKKVLAQIATSIQSLYTLRSSLNEKKTDSSFLKR